MRSFSRTAAVLAASALVLAACGGSDESAEPAPAAPAAPAPATPETPAPAELEGTLIGAGASSQRAAMQGWQAGFQTLNPGVTVEYDPIGSGGGRDTFVAGGTMFAGSDSLMDDEEYGLSIDRCAGDQGAIHLPHYISPVAVAFNLEGIDSINLSPETLASIFTEDITNWSDPAIVAENPGVDLPDLAINPVHRSDESGTSENFTDYLATVAPDIWTYGEVGEWPFAGNGEGAQGTSGVVAAITAGNGSIGYADASQIGDLGVVAIGVGSDFVPFSAEAAAALVDASPLNQRSEYDLGVSLARDTDQAGVYPIALVSYHIVCLAYETQEEVDLVTAFMRYVASAEGQAAAAESAGSSPISETTRARILESIDQISVG